MNELAREWVAKAEEDYRAAEALLYQLEVPASDSACFHSQQCAEKYLKAFLQEKKVRFERTHVLSILVGLCIFKDKEFKTISGDLDSLEGYGVAIRYPGTSASIELAEEAFAAAMRVRKFIRKKLKLR